MGRGDKGPSEPVSPSCLRDVCGFSAASCALSAHTPASLTPQTRTDSELGAEGGGRLPQRCLCQGFTV